MERFIPGAITPPSYIPFLIISNVVAVPKSTITKLSLLFKQFITMIYNINDNFYVNAIWGNIEATATAGALSASASDTDLGFGVGVMFSIPNSDNMFRLGYEDIDEMSQVSLKFLF